MPMNQLNSPGLGSAAPRLCRQRGIAGFLLSEKLIGEWWTMIIDDMKNIYKEKNTKNTNM